VCLIVCVITETPKGALCSSWNDRKMNEDYIIYIVRQSELPVIYAVDEFITPSYIAPYTLSFRPLFLFYKQVLV
jgi:hypothetical protein